MISNTNNASDFKQLLERLHKGAGVPRWPITASSTGLVDSRTRSVLSYWTLRGTYMEGCYYSNSCSMDSTHSTRRGISCLALVCYGHAFRFPPLGWLLDQLGLFGMYKPAQWLSVVIITFAPTSLTGHLNATFVPTSFYYGRKHGTMNLIFLELNHCFPCHASHNEAFSDVGAKVIWWWIACRQSRTHSSPLFWHTHVQLPITHSCF